MVTALLQRERIQTTLTKAKEVRRKAEKVITLGKKGTMHHRRIALRHVAEKDVLKKVFGPLSERYKTRNGGYTRIIRLGNRPGDNAPMAILELVDREEKKVATGAEARQEGKKQGKSTPAKKASAPAKKTGEKKESKEKKPAKEKK
jgi:large subunit ribosomal protein L17